MTTLAPVRTVEQWAEVLNKEWKRLSGETIRGYRAFGELLIAAKEELGPNGYKQLAELVDYTANTARLFIRVAMWLREHAHVQLPADYTTIDKLARLDKKVCDRLIEDGTVCLELKRNEVSKVLRLERVKADEQRVLSLRPRPGKYKTLVIDPAWEYDWLSIAGRAKPGYGMQSPEQLFALNLKQWAEPECQLWCWTTNNFMYEACKLVEHWGFQHRVILTWVKPPPFGLGSYLRNSTEHCIFATLGNTTTRPAASSIPTHFFAPRGGHSEKPEEFYEIVRAASYPPYGEGNQRKMRPDFTDLFMVGDTLVAAE